MLIINTHFGLPYPFDSMDGDYTDFSDGWFRNIAVFFVTPMIITIFTPIISNVINWGWFEYFGLLDRSFKP